MFMIQILITTCWHLFNKHWLLAEAWLLKGLELKNLVEGSVGGGARVGGARVRAPAPERLRTLIAVSFVAP